jgi:2'-5' RNA ligase
VSEKQYVRAFVAIELPPTITRGLREIQRSLQRSPSAGIRWVPEGNIHLTLKFLGDIPLSQVPDISAVIERAAGSTQPLRLEVVGLGAFPGRPQPRILWAGLGGDTEPLASLANGIDAALAGLGFPRENRPFTPHLTLARVRPEVSPAEIRSVGEAMASLRIPAGLAFVADSVSLMKSLLRPEGACYSRLATASLST